MVTGSWPAACREAINYVFTARAIEPTNREQRGTRKSDISRKRSVDSFRILFYPGWTYRDIYICIYTYTSWYEEREIYVTLRRRNERKSGESYRRRTNLWRSRCEIVDVIGFQQVSQRDDRARIPWRGIKASDDVNAPIF